MLRSNPIILTLSLSLSRARAVCPKFSEKPKQKRSHSTNLDQAGQVFQHSCHGELQEVVVPQVEPGQVDPGEHTQGEAPQPVGVQE